MTGGSSKNVVRVGVVDDHQAPVWGIERVFSGTQDLRLVAAAPTVGELIAATTGLDVVILDLRLADGSTPAENVARLHEVSLNTIVYTSGEHPALLRSAAKAGTLGVVLKSASAEVFINAVRSAASGDAVLTKEWAAAIDGDPSLAVVDLSPQMQRVLTLYAGGETAANVGAELFLSVETVNEYLKRIRQKYADAGRPTQTKLDLFKRAVEDGWLPIPSRDTTGSDAPPDPPQ